VLKAGGIKVECHRAACVYFAHLPDMTPMAAAGIEYVFIAIDLEEIKVDGQHILKVILRYGYLLLLRRLAGMKFLPFLQKLVFGLFVSWIRYAAVYRAYFGALGFVEPADALGAFGGIDNINGLALFNSLVLALRLTRTATDTVIGYLVSHPFGTSIVY